MTAAREWNFGDVWEWIAARFPQEPALLHGSTVRSWEEFDRRAEGVAHALLDAGIDRQERVAQYSRNRPEYLETTFAAFKASLVPLNTNFRYGPEELVYLWTDAGASVVAFDAEFTETCSRLRHELPLVKVWMRIGTGDDCPSWAVPYEEAATASPPARPARERRARSGDDLDLLYTGGTTGMPKGVMWRQHDLFLMIENQFGRTPPEEADLEGYLSRIVTAGPRVLPGPPLMHGTASWFARAALSGAGSVVTLTGARFEARELLDTVVERQVKGICIVGDAFAKPIIAELDAQPGHWDLGHVRLVLSSGAMLSRQSKARLAELVPRAKLVDGLGTSESGSLGAAASETPDGLATTRFVLGANVRVVDEEGRDVVAGSGRSGRLAVAGHIPLGYFGDAEKTAATFVVLDGRRHVIAGDWVTVDADGSVVFLGRGSSCINTGGEKVFPEEVEEVLKQAAGVRDAAVVGVPDDRFGEAVVALVELEPGQPFDEASLLGHVRRRLAGYKVPKFVLRVESVGRHANGKMDHATMKEIAISRLAPS